MDWSEWSSPLSRVLVLLTTLLLLAMPITEHLYNWDKFLRGGPDVEFSLLAWLLFAAMMVLSMNGTMLRPIAMQPGIIAPVSAARVVSQSAESFPLAESVLSQLPASGRSCPLLDDPALVCGKWSGVSVPMRI